MSHQPIVEALLAAPEPAIRWKVRARVLGEAVDAPEMVALREQVRASATVRKVLAPFHAAKRPHAYAKWQGAHWALATLADLGYPPGDEALHPWREQVLNAWLGEVYHRDVEVATKAAVYRHSGVPVMRGRHRAHASQQGNALLFLTALGLADDRCDELVELLLRWRWPDGGWNCDREPTADTSSFCETLLPITGLMELGLLGAPRCADALDLLESMRLADGWPARGRYYRTSSDIALHNDCVDWGGTSTRRANPWITADALAVLRAAGRLD